MAILTVVRYEPAFREFYQQLLSRGKAKKVALVACMCKHAGVHKYATAREGGLGSTTLFECERAPISGLGQTIPCLTWNTVARPLLGSACKRTTPRKVGLYDVFCAILYTLRNSCAWCALPSNFPKWRTVHSYFQRWSEPRESGISLLEEALKKIRWPQHVASRDAMKQPLS